MIIRVFLGFFMAFLYGLEVKNFLMMGMAGVS
jgi:hypothetical protein